MCSADRDNLVAEFRERLRALRRRLLAMIGTTDGELGTLGGLEPGSPHQDSARVAVAETLSRLEGQEKHELDDVVAAEGRLAAGTYGAWEECGRAIALRRLRAMPVARRCCDGEGELEGVP